MKLDFVTNNEYLFIFLFHAPSFFFTILFKIWVYGQRAHNKYKKSTFTQWFRHGKVKQIERPWYFHILNKSLAWINGKRRAKIKLIQKHNDCEINEKCFIFHAVWHCTRLLPNQHQFNADYKYCFCFISIQSTTVLCLSIPKPVMQANVFQRNSNRPIRSVALTMH